MVSFAQPTNNPPHDDDEDLDMPPPLEPASDPSTLTPTITGNQKKGSTSSPTPTGLLHLSYGLPGSENGGRKQWEIRPMKFQELLMEHDSIVIPIFQRPYCWSTRLIESWFRDVIDPSHTTHNPHLVGKSCFQKRYNNNNNGNKMTSEDDYNNDDDGAKYQLVCVDGQQRLTTTMLLIAAIRDAARKQQQTRKSNDNNLNNPSIQNTKLERLIEKAEDFMFNDSKKKDEWMRDNNNLTSDGSSLEAGKILPFSRLVPSYKDRRPYYQCLLGKTKEAKGTIQGIAKATFDQLVARFVNNSNTASNTTVAAAALATTIAKLEKLLQKTVQSMRVMYMEVLFETITLQQLFLWLQEKSLLGCGSLLYNKTPGIKFQASDLVRNLILSTFLDQSEDEQTRYYQSIWLPFDLQFSNSAEMDDAIATFLDQYDKQRQRQRPRQQQQQQQQQPEDDNEMRTESGITARTPPPCYPRHVSDFEVQSAQVVKMFRKEMSEFPQLVIYGRFLSLYEELSITTTDQALWLLSHIAAAVKS